MTQIRDDLWRTRTESPFPGADYTRLSAAGPNASMLFYSPASDADFGAIEQLGGVSAQYLSHLVSGADGETYLCTGDMTVSTGDGTWSTFLVPGRGSAAALRSSLELLATVCGHRDLQCLWRRHGDRDTRRRPVA